MTRPVPPMLAADLARARATQSWTIAGPRSRIELCEDLDERDELLGLLPFGTDGGGGVWYCDVDDRLGGGAGAIVHLHKSSRYGDARRMKPSYAELRDALAEGLDPYELPTLDDEATAELQGPRNVPGIEGTVLVKRAHARTRRAAEVVADRDVIAGGYAAKGGARILLTDEGRVHFLTLAARAVVEGIPCASDTELSLHPETGRPLRFTPDVSIEIDGLPFRGKHEVSVYDPIFSASVSGVLDRDHDVARIPLAEGTRVVLLGEERALMSGTLRAPAMLGGEHLEAGTWFEMLGEVLYRKKSPGERA